MNKDLTKDCELCRQPDDESISHIEKIKQEAFENKDNILDWDCSPVCSSCRAVLNHYGIFLRHKASYRLSKPTFSR